MPHPINKIKQITTIGFTAKEITAVLSRQAIKTHSTILVHIPADCKSNECSGRSSDSFQFHAPSRSVRPVTSIAQNYRNSQQRVLSRIFT